MFLQKHINILKQCSLILILLFVTLGTGISYGINKNTVSTFANNQSQANLADNLFNTCRTYCPTESQTLFSTYKVLQQPLLTANGSIPPSALFANLWQTVLFIFVTFWSVVFFKYIDKSKQKMYALWRY